jgi:hypothetical protein
MEQSNRKTAAYTVKCRALFGTPRTFVANTGLSFALENRTPDPTPGDVDKEKKKSSFHSAHVRAPQTAGGEIYR